MRKNENGCCIYTDGSKMRGRVGCAFVCILDNIEIFNEQKRLSDEASVFMAELKAIEAAIISANAHHFPLGQDHIRLQISPTKPCPTLTTAPLQLLNLIANSNLKSLLGLSIKHIKTELAKAIKTEWQLQWSSSSKGRAVHELCQHVCSQRIHGNYFLNQIITGHGALASYQHKFFNSSPVCSCGKEIEDRAHIIFKCEIWTDIRGRFFPKNFSSPTMGVWHWAVRRDLCLGPGPGFSCTDARGCCGDTFHHQSYAPLGAGRIYSRLSLLVIYDAQF
ncbi:uncharacterized protein CEXT_9091 [Caerostris extrusa]|uniref:RNase H type-1 domain-containing protein n=1 Tax=Caerostris extrusa TaxID=172846 RepID=A0AAV4XMR5_CAEEX|nr:uncharacterized protein CEXT_9091 [Caerostris extrusa]